MTHILTRLPHEVNARLEDESKFTMKSPGMKLLRRHPVRDVDSAIRRAIRVSPLGCFPSAHFEEHDPNDALTARFHIYPASLLPFEVMSVIFMHAYDAALLLRRSDQIAHSVACVNRQWRSIALGSPRLWATITVGHWMGHLSRYTSLALARSKELPITVTCISTSVDALKEFTRQVMPHSPVRQAFGRRASPMVHISSLRS